MTYQEYKALVKEEVLNYYAERTGKTVEAIKTLCDNLPIFCEEVAAKVQDVLIEILRHQATPYERKQLNQLIASR